MMVEIGLECGVNDENSTWDWSNSLIVDTLRLL